VIPNSPGIMMQRKVSFSFWLADWLTSMTNTLNKLQEFLTNMLKYNIIHVSIFDIRRFRRISDDNLGMWNYWNYIETKMKIFILYNSVQSLPKFTRNEFGDYPKWSSNQKIRFRSSKSTIDFNGRLLGWGVDNSPRVDSSDIIKNT
jgi:hypothetical protein